MPDKEESKMSKDLRVKIDITGNVNSGKSVIATIIKNALVEHGLTNIVVFDSDQCHHHIEKAMTERQEEIIESIIAKDVRILLVDCNQPMLPVSSHFVETFQSVPTPKEVIENVDSK